MKWNEPGRQAGARKEEFVDYIDGFYMYYVVLLTGVETRE